MEKNSENPEKTVDSYDKDAYIRFLCEGLNGKGCGTSFEYITSHRKKKSWEEKCQDFQRHQGD